MPGFYVIEKCNFFRLGQNFENSIQLKNIFIFKCDLKILEQFWIEANKKFECNKFLIFNK